MNRRGFLAALAGLPVVGWLFPQGQCQHDWECVVARCSRKVDGLQVSMDEICQLCRKNAKDSQSYSGLPPLLKVKCRKCQAEGRADILPMMEEAERRFRQIRKQKVTLTCVCCDCTDVVTLPAEMVLTGMLKTGKHVCEDCRQLTQEDWTWHSQH